MDLNQAFTQIIGMSSYELREVFEGSGGQFILRSDTMDVIAPPRPVVDRLTAPLGLVVAAHEAKQIGDYLCGEVNRRRAEIEALIRAERA